jgi:outer membrane lipoprotein SlyB
LLGNSLGYGDSQLAATLIGAGAGGLLGREIDRGSLSCR